MKLASLCFAAALTLSGSAIGAARPNDLSPAKADFELVESVPTGTVYGEAGLRRTAAVWAQMISQATTSIDIAAFYFADKPGSALSPVLDALVERAKAGVKVRVLVDSSFLKTNAETVARFRSSPGFDVRALPAQDLTGGVLHAKYMVVDGTEVFVGSQNWDWRAMDEIHEVGARIRNTRFAQTFTATFDYDWALASAPGSTGKRAPTAWSFHPVTTADPVILGGPGRAGVPDAPVLTAYPAFSPATLMPAGITPEDSALVGFIGSAQKVLRVQVMTLSALRGYGETGWWAPLDTALRDAAARGVEVRIMVADWALHGSMQAYLKSLALMPGITVKFSTVPPAAAGFIPYARVDHAKYAVADDNRVYIGTGNWEPGYFTNTVDASVFVQGVAPVATLTQMFDREWSGPYVTQMDPTRMYQEPKTH